LGENPQPLDATAAIGISYGALYAAVEVDVFAALMTLLMALDQRPWP